MDTILPLYFVTLQRSECYLLMKDSSKQRPQRKNIFDATKVFADNQLLAP